MKSIPKLVTNEKVIHPEFHEFSNEDEIYPSSSNNLSESMPSTKKIMSSGCKYKVKIFAGQSDLMTSTFNTHYENDEVTDK